eukprot:scaffold34649_cov22-Tisochrysis_lutea.AAC.1
MRRKRTSGCRGGDGACYPFSNGRGGSREGEQGPCARGVLRVHALCGSQESILSRAFEFSVQLFRAVFLVSCANLLQASSTAVLCTAPHPA